MKFRRYRTEEEKRTIASHLGPWDPKKSYVMTPRMNREVFYPLDELMRLVPADEADHMHDGDHVLGVAHEGEAKAYPFFIMDYYHELNDTVGGEPIVYNT